MLVADLPAGGALTRLVGFLGFGSWFGASVLPVSLLFEARVFCGWLDVEDEAPLCGDLKNACVLGI